MTPFLAPFRRAVMVGLDEAEQRRRVTALWQALCDRVDPAIRRGLRPNANVTIPDRRAACGAVVALMVLSTRENGSVGQAATIAGTPRSAVTHGNESIVTVDVRYRAMPSETVPPPPARATIHALVVRRGGRWWVATPDAFNPEHAGRGGLSESELHRSYARLLAAAR